MLNVTCVTVSWVTGGSRQADKSKRREDQVLQRLSILR